MAISDRRLGAQKVNILREVTSKVSAAAKRDLDATASGTIDDATEVGVVLDFVAAERLRCMPQAGSRYDKVLRWAEVFCIRVAAFATAVAEAVSQSSDAAQQFWGGTLLLLKVSCSIHTDP